MEHGRLQPMKGASGREKTAFTMKTIKELLEEEALKKTQTPMPLPTVPEVQEPEAAAPSAPEPSAEAAAPAVEAEKPAAPKAAALPPIPPAPVAQAAEQPAEKPRSLLGRLIGS
ncbi:hypothetical protein SAMN05444273_108137 [Litoreibacter ascidiaceicola]|uniref:Uncharacterized protein n=1 Tax=Litoreibacter ascidiaceicola TaxID=1486859 RepID=A0A1M5D8A6_9RHOB|nr:hypothetical protein [Litoreibacter ascidiaceicola]SHF63248.1 hypothetical protein SAMN05444273_108137 [Litoreibacter ascidiaceicola]